MNISINIKWKLLKILISRKKWQNIIQLKLINSKKFF